MQKENYFAIFSILAIIVSWIVGYYLNNETLDTRLIQLFNITSELHHVENNIYNLSTSSGPRYYIVSESNGYGGPLLTSICIDSSGNISDIKLLSQNETTAFFQKIENKNLLSKFIDLNISMDFETIKNMDGISGASLTSEAIIKSITHSSYIAATKIFNHQVAYQKTKNIVFGAKEILLIITVLIGFIAFFTDSKYKKKVRWLSLISSVVILGFVYTIPLTLTNINSFLLGYFPDWHNQLYWYILIIVVFVPILSSGNKIYCANICPFGAAQDCLKFASNKNFTLAGFAKKISIWLPRVLALLLICTALILRNPGIQSHEIFGSAFSLTGTHFQLSLMIIVVISSMFIIRPWCKYLCPVGAVSDFFLFARKSINRTKVR